MPLSAGQTLDHYRIESKLGEGGMGVVYKARDTSLDRLVAIKVLPPDKVADPGRKQRFVQEAKAASALNHPNIVTIYDIRWDGGVDFIVMEYVAGQTLGDVIGARAMRPAQVLKYAVQIAGALAAAHGVGIVHRDLKPSNIMVSENGCVKILDFGLAKLLEPPDSSVDGATLTARELTEEGAVMGTAAYMSPEQAEGKKVDARSDIFSFGIIIYEMITGRRPFTAHSRLTLLTKILNEDPQPPSQLVPALPPDLEKIILRCLRKDPGRRYQTMLDVKVSLEDLEVESGFGRQPAPARPHRRWVWSLLVLVLVGVGYFGSSRWHTQQSPEVPRTVALTTFPGVVSYPSFSPDGNHVAFTWNGPRQDNPDVYVQQIGVGSPLRLTTDRQNDHSPVWSPDGRWIAFLRGEFPGRGELRLVPPLGGPERKLAEIQVREQYVTPPYLTWSRDSNYLVVTNSQGEGRPDALYVISLETGEKRQLTHPPVTALGDSNPAISNDGRSMVFRRAPASDADELYWLPLGQGPSAAAEPRRLTAASLNARYPAWLPGGKEILFSARDHLWRLAVPGEHTPAQIPFVGEDGTMSVTASPAGGLSRLVYVRRYIDWNLWRVETSAAGVPASSPPAVTFASTRLEATPQFSPDGHRLAFASNRSGNWEIWVGDADGSDAVQLTSLGAPLTATPRWSADGQLITFDSNLEGHYEIYVVSAAGGKPRRITSGRGNSQVPSFSRDGKWVYFCSNRNGEDYQIWKVPTLGGDAIQVTRNTGYVAFESLDGAHLYDTQTSGAASALWRLPVSGVQPVKVLDGVVARGFVVLKDGIYYLDQLSGEARLQFFDFATNQSTTVAHNLGRLIYGLAASPDGRTVIYARLDSSLNDLMLVENFR